MSCSQRLGVNCQRNDWGSKGKRRVHGAPWRRGLKLGSGAVLQFRWWSGAAASVTLESSNGGSRSSSSVRRSMRVKTEGLWRSAARTPTPPGPAGWGRQSCSRTRGARGVLGHGQAGGAEGRCCGVPPTRAQELGPAGRPRQLRSPLCGARREAAAADGHAAAGAWVPGNDAADGAVSGASPSDHRRPAWLVWAPASAVAAAGLCMGPPWALVQLPTATRPRRPHNT